MKYGDTEDLPVEQRQYTQWYKNVLDAYKDSSDQFINRLVNYQATVVGFDKALGVLINQLKEYGIYDDTTIILYSDHNAYYHTLSNELKGLPATEYMDIDLNTIPLIIKSSGVAEKSMLEGKRLNSIDRFCSAYDLLPTVLDLLGIKFNKRLYVGNSVFAPIDDVYTNEMGETKEIVVYYSLTGGLISDKMYTFNMNDFYYDEFATISYYEKFKKVSSQTLKKLNYIYTLYVYNAYQYIIPVS